MRIGVANEMCLGWMFQSLDNFGYPFITYPTSQLPNRSRRDSALQCCRHLLSLCAHIPYFLI